MRQCVESKVRTSSVEELAKTVDSTPETLKLIIDGLAQPPGFDIRQSKTPAIQRHTEIRLHNKVNMQTYLRKINAAYSSVNYPHLHRLKNGLRFQIVGEIEQRLHEFMFSTYYNYRFMANQIEQNHS